MLHGVPGVDDVLDQQHIPAFNFTTDVLDDPDFPGRFHGVAVGRHFQEVDFNIVTTPDGCSQGFMNRSHPLIITHRISKARCIQ